MKRAVSRIGHHRRIRREILRPPAAQGEAGRFERGGGGGAEHCRHASHALVAQFGPAWTGPDQSMITSRPCSFNRARWSFISFSRSGGVALPLLDLADDPERLARAVRFGRIAGEFLVGQVRVVDDLAGRLDDVDPPAPVADGQLRAPDRRLQRAGQIDPGQFSLAEIGAVADRDQVSRFQVGLRAVIERPGYEVLGGCHRKRERAGAGRVARDLLRLVLAIRYCVPGIGCPRNWSPELIVSPELNSKLRWTSRPRGSRRRPGSASPRNPAPPA